MNFCGVRLALNPFPRIEVREVRVPGGYMNQWLIRAFVLVPVREMIHDPVKNVIYCDPESLRELRHMADADFRGQINAL